jgi:hypothetical protein
MSKIARIWTGSAWEDITGIASNGGGGSASGTPLNIPDTLVSRSSSGTFAVGGVDLDLSGTVPLAVGRFQWNSSFGTPEVGLTGGNVTAHIGQHVHAYVTNAQGSPLVKGDVVYLFGASGDRASVKKAINTADPTSAKTLGVVAEEITTGGQGYVTVFGVVDKLNLSAYSPGDTLWLSASAGKFTSVKPSAPNHTVFIGVVERANAGNGQLFVNIQNGYELDELHNVSIINAADNDIISYNQSASLWFNQNLATAITEVDGAGSGIDADLLDGQHGSYYQDAAGASATYLRIDTASSTYLSITNAEQSYIPISASYRTFDADKLDGYDASFFLNSSSAVQEKNGNFTFHGILTVNQLVVSGSYTTIESSILAVTDSLIQLAHEQYNSDGLDIGFVGSYGDETTSSANHYHASFARDASQNKWKLLSKGPLAVNNVIDYTDPSVEFGVLQIAALEVSSSATVTNFNADMLDGYHSSYFLAAGTASSIYLTQANASATYATQQDFDNVLVLQWMGIG